MSKNASAAPSQDAIDKFQTRVPVASELNSEQWADIPVGLRERAFFSATVQQAETLQAMDEKITQSLSMMRDDTGAYMNRSRFIGDMRVALAGQESTGGMDDITTRQRLGLIYDVNTQQAFGFANYKYDMDADVLNFYPAQILIRVDDRKNPRDWRSRWNEAGDSVGWQGAAQNVMVALKTSPIWQALSRFGTPWPPFDYGSGMGVEDIGRQEAEGLGLLERGERLEPAADGFNDTLAASVSDLSPNMVATLRKAFGTAIKIAKGIASWVAK